MLIETGTGTEKGTHHKNSTKRVALLQSEPYHHLIEN
jgi:hypothetical protein